MGNEMKEKKTLRLRTRRLWRIKPFERIQKSRKTYSRGGNREPTGDELSEDTEPRRIGLDVGERRIGVSISDPLGLTAQPLGVIDSENAVAKLRQLTKKFEVERFVIGHPLNMKGERGERALSVEEFAKNLEDATGIPYTLIDERLSSKASERALREMGEKPSRKKEAVDQMAAIIILQSYLDRVNSMRSEEEDEDA
jgi:putative Holliday junction resolvase